MKPIHPKDLISSIPSSFPDIIIEAVNNILITNYAFEEIKMTEIDIRIEMRKTYPHAELPCVTLTEIADLFRKFEWGVRYVKSEVDDDVPHLIFTSK